MERKTKKSVKTTKKAPKVSDLDEEKRKRAILKQKHCDAVALHIVGKLIEGAVEEDVFLQTLKYINQCHFQDIIEERAILKNCGYPVCFNKIPELPNQTFHISTKSNKVYDVTDRKNFCSNFCYTASNYIKNQILTSPLWYRDQEEIPKFELLKKNIKVTPGEEIDQGLIKIEKSDTFISTSDFTQNVINEIPDDFRNHESSSEDENENLRPSNSSKNIQNQPSTSKTAPIQIKNIDFEEVGEIFEKLSLHEEKISLNEKMVPQLNPNVVSEAPKPVSEIPIEKIPELPLTNENFFYSKLFSPNLADILNENQKYFEALDSNLNKNSADSNSEPKLKGILSKNKGKSIKKSKSVSFHSEVEKTKSEYNEKSPRVFKKVNPPKKIDAENSLLSKPIIEHKTIFSNNQNLETKPQNESFNQNLETKARNEAFSQNLETKAQSQSFSQNLETKAQSESFSQNLKTKGKSESLKNLNQCQESQFDDKNLNSRNDSGTNIQKLTPEVSNKNLGGRKDFFLDENAFWEGNDKSDRIQNENSKNLDKKSETEIANNSKTQLKFDSKNIQDPKNSQKSPQNVDNSTQDKSRNVAKNSTENILSYKIPSLGCKIDLKNSDYDKNVQDCQTQKIEDQFSKAVIPSNKKFVPKKSGKVSDDPNSEKPKNFTSEIKNPKKSNSKSVDPETSRLFIPKIFPKNNSNVLNPNLESKSIASKIKKSDSWDPLAQIEKIGFEKNLLQNPNYSNAKILAHKFHGGPKTDQNLKKIIEKISKKGPKDLKNQNVVKGDLKDQNVEKGDLKNQNLEKGDLKDQNFGSEDLQDQNFEKLSVDLKKLNLENEDPKDLNLEKEDFKNQNFESGDLKNPSFENVNLKNPNLGKEDFKNQNFESGDLKNPILENVDPKNPNFECEDLKEQNFENSSEGIKEPKNSSKELKNQNFESGNQKNLNFENGDLKNPNFKNTKSEKSKKSKSEDFKNPTKKSVNENMEKSKNLGPKNPDFENFLEIFESRISEWFTIETMIFLYGENEVKKILTEKNFKEYLNLKKDSVEKLIKCRKYEDICKKLNLMEMTDQYYDEKIKENSKKPLPSYNQLKLEAENLDLRVQAFYSGCFEVIEENSQSDYESENESDSENPALDKGVPAVLPLCENKDFLPMRRKVFLSSLNRTVTQICEKLEISDLDPNVLKTDLNELVDTFNFDSKNIIFKTVQWPIVTLFLIKLLGLKNQNYLEILKSEKSKNFYEKIVDPIFELKFEEFFEKNVKIENFLLKMS